MNEESNEIAASPSKEANIAEVQGAASQTQYKRQCSHVKIKSNCSECIASIPHCPHNRKLSRVITYISNKIMLACLFHLCR
jgi:hypothetical protein